MRRYAEVSEAIQNFSASFFVGSNTVSLVYINAELVSLM